MTPPDTDYYHAPNAPLAPPNKRPCKECPYRRTNSRGPIPNTDYTMEVEGPRLWNLALEGTVQSCHLTDDRQLAYSPDMKIPTDRPIHVCTGMAAMIGRELDLLENEFGGDFRAYSAAHPRGFTARGAEFWRWARGQWPDAFQGFLEEEELRAPVA